VSGASLPWHGCYEQTFWHFFQSFANAIAWGADVAQRYAENKKIIKRSRALRILSPGNFKNVFAANFRSFLKSFEMFFFLF
jgi:hypothetical protein